MVDVSSDKVACPLLLPRIRRGGLGLFDHIQACPVRKDVDISLDVRHDSLPLGCKLIVQRKGVEPVGIDIHLCCTVIESQLVQSSLRRI